MSYCRWSSDNYKSDVYVYQSKAGWELMVAGRRRIGLETLPEFPSLPTTDDREAFEEQWFKPYTAYNKALEKLELVPIEHEWAGAQWTLPSPGECASKLRELRDAGFHVPDGVIETLEEEQNEESSHGAG